MSNAHKWKRRINGLVRCISTHNDGSRVEWGAIAYAYLPSTKQTETGMTNTSLSHTNTNHTLLQHTCSIHCQVAENSWLYCYLYTFYTDLCLRNCMSIKILCSSKNTILYTQYWYSAPFMKSCKFIIPKPQDDCSFYTIFAFKNNQVRSLSARACRDCASQATHASQPYVFIWMSKL